jgi:hypothetical protein
MSPAGKRGGLLFAFGLAISARALLAQGAIASATGASPAGAVSAITDSTPLSNFTLTLTGTFHPAFTTGVLWHNTATGNELFFSIDGDIDSVTNTQISLKIPNNLFSVSASSRQTVEITEYEIQAGCSLRPAPRLRSAYNPSPCEVASNKVYFYINPALQPGPLSLPAGTVGFAYSSPALATGGTAPFTPSATSGLPPGLSIDSTTLKLTGTPTLAGSYSVGGMITDAWGNSLPLSGFLVVYPTPIILSLTPAAVGAGSLDTTVDIQGQGFVVSNFTPSTVVWKQGSIQTTLSSQVLSATEIQAIIPGAFLNAPGSALIQVVQPTGAPSAAVPFAINAPVISQVNPTSVPAGSGAFTMVVSGAYFVNSLGPGSLRSRVIVPGMPRTNPGSQIVFGSTALATTFVNSNTLTATVPSSLIAAAGNISVRVVNPGGASSNAYSFLVTVPVPPLEISGSLPPGVVGTAYTASFAASGGTPDYQFSLAGGSLPAGLTLAANGLLTGTPTQAGQFRFTVQVTDAAGLKVSKEFFLTIVAPPLHLTGSIGNLTLGAAVNVTFGATGGVPPYNFSAVGILPSGTVFSNGTISGTPNSLGTFSFTISVMDQAGTVVSQNFSVQVVAPPLLITTTSLPPATVGSSVSGSVSATGGVPPYQWSAFGLPSGVSLSSSGTLSGTPNASGTASVTLTVTDSRGTQASATLPMTVGLPSPPRVNFNGLGSSVNPASQAAITLGLNGPYPVDMVANLTMTFAPDSGPDDPAVQFATGGRTATQVIPAGSTVSLTSIGIQTGTVAGLITITARLTAAGQDVTGSPAPSLTIRVNAMPPVISTVTAVRTGNGFTITITGYASSRDITQAIFQFTSAAGTTLANSSVTVPVDALFRQWYQSPQSASFGSQFTYTQPFTVTGSVDSIISVSVTLVGASGQSTIVSVNLR